MTLTILKSSLRSSLLAVDDERAGAGAGWAAV